MHGSKTVWKINDDDGLIAYPLKGHSPPGTWWNTTEVAELDCLSLSNRLWLAMSATTGQVYLFQWQ